MPYLALYLDKRCQVWRLQPTQGDYQSMSENARTKEPIEIYTIPELCEALDVSDKTLAKILRSGELKGRKVGRRWTVTREALEEYLGMHGRQSA